MAETPPSAMVSFEETSAMVSSEETSAVDSSEEIQRRIEEVEFSGRQTGPRLGMVVGTVALAWSLFQLWIASPLPFLFDFAIIVDVPARGIHLAFGLVLVFLLYPRTRAQAHSRISWLDILFAVLGGFCALWVFIDQEGIANRLGSLLTLDLLGVAFPFEALLGGAGLVLLLEATRRAIGLPLVVLALLFLVYALFGQSMPELISHRGVSPTRLIGYQWLGGESIFGIPIGVSVSFVFLFVLFGALLDRAGAGKFFLDLSFGLVGRFRGGPAKAAILASGMTGMISGSSIANVVTTGVFTIPVMRKMGLSAVKAGAIEVAASTNGQLMPPIMGAAAFIIAELVGISYFDVVVAAIVPALVAYMGLLYISHLEAMKLGLKRMPARDIPPLGKTFLAGAHFLVPILVLVYLLMIERWSASSAVFYTIMVMFLILIAGRVAPAGLPRSLAGILFAIPVILAALARGLLGADPQSALFLGLGSALFLVAGLALVKQVREGGLGGSLAAAVADIHHGLVAGARNMIGIAVAVAAAGIIVGSVSSTGLNNAMVGLVEALSGGNVYILLILTAVLALVLGMGLPTTANYLVVASLLAGVLVEIGNASGLVLPLIAVHLFVFYFGILADATPPVCLAAFAAAAISRADPLKTGVQGFFYDIRTAILPFVFIFNPELLLIGVTSLWHGLSVFLVSLIAIFCFASATQGWLLIRTKLYEIVLLLGVTFALFRPDFFLDLVHPAFAPQPMGRFISGQVSADKGLKLRLHVVRETNYGDRFKMFIFTSPGGTVGQKTFGLRLGEGRDGRHAVADLAFMGAGKKAKMSLGDFVTEVDLEQIGRPPKEWVYPLAFLVLGFVFASQLVRRRRQIKTAVP